MRAQLRALTWMQRQLLDAPVVHIRDKQRVLGWTRHAVNPAELAGFMPGFAEHPQDLAIQRQFVNAPRLGVRRV